MLILIIEWPFRFTFLAWTGERSMSDKRAYGSRNWKLVQVVGDGVIDASN
jgi:hypothetical protein